MLLPEPVYLDGFAMRANSYVCIWRICIGKMLLSFTHNHTENKVDTFFVLVKSDTWHYIGSDTRIWLCVSKLGQTRLNMHTIAICRFWQGQKEERQICCQCLWIATNNIAKNWSSCRCRWPHCADTVIHANETMCFGQNGMSSVMSNWNCSSASVRKFLHFQWLLWRNDANITHINQPMSSASKLDLSYIWQNAAHSRFYVCAHDDDDVCCCWPSPVPEMHAATCITSILCSSSHMAHIPDGRGWLASVCFEPIYWNFQ